MLYGLAEEGRRQVTLREACMPEADAKQRELMKAVDSVNDRFGRGTVRSAAEGAFDAFWHMRRQKMSPHYTTRWDDMRVAFCL